LPPFQGDHTIGRGKCSYVAAVAENDRDGEARVGEGL
jgi:hypothetical protein